MTGKVAMDGEHVLITVVETISGYGTFFTSASHFQRCCSLYQVVLGSGKISLWWSSLSILIATRTPENRLPMVDGHGSHVSIPIGSSHLLQLLDVGLFSPLQKVYAKQVDKAVRYGLVTSNKGNFLPLLVKVRDIYPGKYPIYMATE